MACGITVNKSGIPGGGPAGGGDGGLGGGGGSSPVPRVSYN